MTKKKSKREKVNQMAQKKSDQSSPSSSCCTSLKNISSCLLKAPLFLCHNIIFGPIKFKLIVYFSFIIIGSLLQALNLAPNSYFSSKKNIFNVYFAKFAWGWTLAILAPFIYLNLRQKLSTLEILSQHLSRLLIGSFIWYTLTNLFTRIELETGSCKHSSFSDATKFECIKNGHAWNEGHDISGHIFLLMYAVLIINEELQAYDRCYKIPTSKSKVPNDEATTNEVEVQNKLVEKLASIVHMILPSFAAFLTILWEFMILSTSLYFHTMLHKIEGGIIATICWWITYRLWFQENSKSFIIPATPKSSSTSSRNES